MQFTRFGKMAWVMYIVVAIMLHEVIRPSKAADIRQAVFRRMTEVASVTEGDYKLACAFECLASAACAGFYKGVGDQGCKLVTQAAQCPADAPCYVKPSALGRRTIVGTLNVTNGHALGDLAPAEFCPDGSFAAGFQIRFLPYQGRELVVEDDEAATAFRLFCANTDTLLQVANVTSHPGFNGEWQEGVYCPHHYWITAFILQVEALEPAGDVTGVNKMSVVCRGEGLGGSKEMVLQGIIVPEMPDGWGTYGEWSASCDPGSAVCGLATRVLANLGAGGDDLGVTDVTLYCC